MSRRMDPPILCSCLQQLSSECIHLIAEAAQGHFLRYQVHWERDVLLGQGVCDGRGWDVI